jgi:hypothetical protein
MKVDALNAHLDSLHGKQDSRRQEECRKTDEATRDRILLNNHRRVVRNLLLNIRYYRTIRAYIGTPAQAC